MKKFTIVEVVLFAETIMRYFDEIIQGLASDMVYYEVLQSAEVYLEKPYEGFESYLEMTLGIDKKALTKIKKQWQNRIKEIDKFL